jgi:predicted nucleic acid-binding Zn ribbon protein
MFRLSRFATQTVVQAVRAAPLCDEKVIFAWRIAVGPAVAKATTVRLDAEGVMHVSAADRRWLLEVRRSAPVIQSRLEAVLGADLVKRISVTP